MAFVLIPHLDPKHESLMVELLARCTKMPVVEATDGMAVEANRVYVIETPRAVVVGSGEFTMTAVGAHFRGTPSRTQSIQVPSR